MILEEGHRLLHTAITDIHAIGIADKNYYFDKIDQVCLLVQKLDQISQLYDNEYYWINAVSLECKL